MSSRRRPRPCLLFVALGALPVLSAGCARSTSALSLTSYKDPYFPETYQVKLADCVYYVDPGGDYHIVGRASHTTTDGTDATITQLLHVHLFWKPWPGKTFDDPSTVDATVRYALVTEHGTAVYRGTGFVYPKQQRLSNRLIARIEGAQLRLESQTGAPPELLGDARVVGTLVAEDNASLAVDLRRQLDLYIGPQDTP